MPGENTGCVLVADVSGSTKLHETVGDSAAQEAVELCMKLFRALTEQHGGRVVKTAGDEVVAIFPDANGAGKAAVDIQLSVNEMAPVEKVRLGVRVGLHHGAFVEHEGDVFGDAVSFAARLTEIASKGQIITSLETAERFDPIRKMDCRRLFSIPVKGREQEVDVCELMWSDTDDATALVAHRATTDAGDQLRLVYRGRVTVFTPESGSLVLGRDASSGLVVADRMASRAHCLIEQRQGRFVLADSSANGTYVSIDGDSELVLKGDETTLRGHGFIALGQPRATATELVEFFCE